MDIRQQLLAAFEAEHREHLDAIRSALAGGADATDWNDVFRRAHSLKGASRAVDLPPIEAVAHRLETLFERVRSGKQDLDATTRAATHLALDRIEAFVADMKAGIPVMPSDALSALDACLADEAVLRTGPPPASLPLASTPPASKPPTSENAWPTDLPFAAAEPSGDISPSVLRVPASAVAAMSEASHELAGALSGQDEIAARLARLAAGMAELRRRAGGLGEPHPGRGIDAVPHADIAALTTDLAVIARASADLARDHAMVASALERAGARVRDEAERLALVPAETAFGAFARTLRETGRTEGRSVDVRVRGLDLSVERAMLQALRDPVLHALRNAVSHGSEPEAERLRSGRPAALGIDFEVGIRGGTLCIAIHDDGRGPDLGAIETRARERGLLAPGAAATSERLLGFVFEPGFSTASAVDALSGRGVGLSVVAEAVRRLRGSVRLEPRRPHGASLVMTLPLSAARRAVLVVEAGGATYAIPAEAAERLHRLDPAAFDTVAGRPVARLDDEAGTVLAVADLAAVLGGRVPRAPGLVPAVLLKASGRRCLLTVERLHEVRTLLVLAAPRIGIDSALVSGTVILDGAVPALVLDPDTLVDRARNAIAQPLPKPVGTMPEARRSTILVVDDSITTRTLEKSILEAAGYRVVVCVDGQDALERLRAGIEPIDLVVADVEMPRLDGFGLVAALRADDAFARLPVILMTSRGAAEDVARGLELGADAYLTKQTFDQSALLDTVGQLL